MKVIFRNMINKYLLWIIIFILVAVILYSIIQSYWKDEGFTVPNMYSKVPKKTLTLQTMNHVKKIIFTGYEYFNITELVIFDSDGNPYSNNKEIDYSVVCNSMDSTKTIYDHLNTQYYPISYFSSSSNMGPGQSEVSFIITFSNPSGVDLGSILIRNRYDGYWDRLSKFSMDIIDFNGNSLLPKKKKLDDPSLSNYQTAFKFNNDFPDPATTNKYMTDIKTNHMNDNVILYEFAKKYANIFTSADVKQSLIKTITLSGEGLLNLSELKIYDMYDNEYTYITDFNLSTNSKQQFYNNDPTYGFDKLFDNNPTTFFASHENKNVIFTIIFTEPAGVKVGKIFIRNRMDCCQTRINQYVLNMYDVNGKSILLNKNKPLIEPSLTSSLLGSTDSEDILSNHKNDNMITYKICRPYHILKMNSGAFTKTITITGNNWLHISKLIIIGLGNGNILTTYKHKEHFYVTTNSPPKNDVDNMFNNDINTYFQSGNDKNVILKIIFKRPVFIYGMFLVNRMDCCWKRITNFTMTVYDEKNNILTEKILDDPYLYNYQSSTGKFSNAEINGNCMGYIFDTNKFLNIDASAITSTHILGGGKNGDITYDSSTKYFNYKITSIAAEVLNKKNVSRLELSNYIFMVGKKYRISITCNTDDDGVLNNMYFYYCLSTKMKDILFTSPILFSTPQTYTTTITPTSTGILSINIVAPVGNTFSYCTFSVEHIHVKKNKLSFISGSSPGNIAASESSPTSTTTPSSTSTPTPTVLNKPIPTIASLSTPPSITEPVSTVSPYMNLSSAFNSYKVYTTYNSEGVNSGSSVL